MPKDNEAATWREKLDMLYKTSSQSFRVVVHGSKVWNSFFWVVGFLQSLLILQYFSISCFARKLAAGILKRNEILHTIPFNLLITCHDVVSMIWIPYTAFV